MTRRQKPIDLAKGIEVVIASAQAALTCLAEEAHRLGNTDLYHDTRSFNTAFEKESEKFLQQIGVTTSSRKMKPKLQLV